MAEDLVDKIEDFLNKPQVKATINEAGKLAEKAAKKAKEVYNSEQVQGAIQSVKDTAENVYNSQPVQNALKKAEDFISGNNKNNNP